LSSNILSLNQTFLSVWRH